MTEAARTSIDPDEVARFSALAAEWWDPKGKFAPLHLINPVRLGFIREQALARFGRDAAARRPFEGLSALDIGCGGGLLCEPLARLGFKVTGADASERNIGTASAHAAELELQIDYRASTAEALLARGARFDLVLNMEVIEHVADPGAFLFDLVLNMEVIEHVADPGVFLRDTASLLAPGGMMIVATLNRTLKSLALGKLAAEYLLRWIPPGTHDWRKFLTPDELRAFLAGQPFDVAGPFGVAFDPIRGQWSRSNDIAVNYMMTVAPKGAAEPV
jgi:2-polyprenyl-6-hydroxyphenyl methylase/3-demethylubiquinone-9 3-methyltransferase